MVLSSTFFLFSLLSSRGFASPVLSTRGGDFIDPEGRVVILRGLNVAGNFKLPPFEPSASLEPLPGWGVNVVRLIVNWEAYEPQSGSYNESYLNRVVKVADDAWRKGIYVIIDLHQDAYSRYFSPRCGEGFPAWTVPEKIRTFSSDESNCGPLWVVRMFLSPAMHSAFRDFYSDSGGARSAYLRLWKRLAERFVSHPGVVGYDLINEPWGDEESELATLYADASRTIHDIDPTALIFFEPTTRGTVFGWRRTQLPRPPFSHAVYAPHYYDPRVVVLNAWYPFFSSVERRAYQWLIDSANGWGVPLFVGEFGAPGKVRHAERFAEAQYQFFTEHFVSAAQWSYTPGWRPDKKDGWNFEDTSIVDDRGNLRPNYRPFPYAQKISGTPMNQTLSLNHSENMVSLELGWNDSGKQLETEIFIPESPMPGIFWDVRSGDGDLNCRHNILRSKVICISKTAGLKSVRLLQRKQTGLLPAFIF